MSIVAVPTKLKVKLPRPHYDITEIMEGVDAHFELQSFKLYRPYQYDGITWMLNRELNEETKGGILADEPGLGKTIQTAGVCFGNPVKRTLILVPPAVISQWVAVMTTIFGEENVYVHVGADRCATAEDLLVRTNTPDEWSYTIASHHMLLNYEDLERPTVLNDIAWDRVVMDECHVVRNKGTKLHKQACAIRAKYRWGLSGTPVQNKITDIINLFRFLNVHAVGLKLDELIEKLILRRTKAMVFQWNAELEMPELSVHNHVVPFENEEERAFYHKIFKNAKNAFELLSDSDTGASAIAMLELLLRLRQASAHPHIVVRSYERKLKRKLKSMEHVFPTKMKAIVEHVASHKELALVFCHFIDEMNFFERYFEERGIGTRKYHGGMSMAERDDAIEDFRDNHSKDAPRVLLIQIKAGGVGLNLQMFNQVYLSAPDWNPCNELQAIARAHRMGQERPVEFHRFILVDPSAPVGTEGSVFMTVDERINVIQKEKRRLMATILKDDSLLETGKMTKKSLERMMAFGRATELTASDLASFFN
jgi:SNF2 family DNA or RNA helicase